MNTYSYEEMQELRNALHLGYRGDIVHYVGMSHYFRLEAAGGGAEHMVRMTWYLVDKKDYVARLKDIGAAYREVMGRHFPAMTAVQVVSLVEDRALVEIEVTAVVPSVAEGSST